MSNPEMIEELTVMQSLTMLAFASIMLEVCETTQDKKNVKRYIFGVIDLWSKDFTRIVRISSRIYSESYIISEEIREYLDNSKRMTTMPENLVEETEEVKYIFGKDRALRNFLCSRLRLF